MVLMYIEILVTDNANSRKLRAVVLPKWANIDVAQLTRKDARRRVERGGEMNNLGGKKQMKKGKEK
jgi:hypothetical protein